MSFWYTTFDSLALPTMAPVHDVGTGRVQSPLVALPGGGVFDPVGSDDAQMAEREIQSDFTIVESTAAALRTTFNALRAKVGVRGRLYREHDTGDTEWVYARMQEIRGRRSTPEVTFQKVSIKFQVISPVWNGHLRGSGWTLDSGEVLNDGLTLDDTGARTLSSSPITITWTNRGNQVARDAVITVTAGSAAITALTVARLVSGSVVEEWTYSGTISSGKALVVDCGAWSVEDDGSGDWDNFVFTSNHSTEDILQMQPGDNSIRFTVTGGDVDSTVQIEFYDGWA